MVATVAEPRIDLALKLLARAMCPSAPEAEALNAAEKFVRIVRLDGVTFDNLSMALSPPIRRERQRRAPRPAVCRLRMPHGKWEGATLLRIAHRDLPYLEWVCGQHNDPVLRSAASIVLAYIAREAA